jgi:alkanesulfonate monooxygenase SsuD/methylene tetrahydromethanopterin reductase-like flavin-dependent oxidoreductase (luciferase family)
VIVAVGGWQFESGPVERRRHNQLYAEFVDDARLAEELGFGAIFTSEHHFWSDGSCPNPLLPLASVSRATSSISLGTAVMLLLLHDPRRLAAQAAMLDEISGGRALLGLGMGYRDEEYDAFGIDRRTRGRRFEDALTVLSGALDPEAEAVLPRPHRRVPLWLGGHADVTIARAARHGCGLLLPPVLSPEEATHCVARFREEEAAAGREPGLLPVAVHVTVYVDRTTDGAEAFFLPRIEQIYRETYAAWGRFTDEAGVPIRTDRPELLARQIENVTSRVVCGSPEQVAGRLDWTAESGADLLICKVQAGSVPQPQLHASMTLLATEVLPRLLAPAPAERVR